VVAFFCWREFLVPNINFVRDFAQSDSGTHLKVSRLYSKEIDHDAFEAELERILNLTDYTEEEIFYAAIAAGEPAFFPTFNFGVNYINGQIHIDGFIDIDVAENQTEDRFIIGEIGLEAAVPEAGGFTIDEVEIFPSDANGENPLPKIYNEQQAAVDITNAQAFRIRLDGIAGRVTIQFVYAVNADTFMPRAVSDEQVLLLHADIVRNDNGIIDIDWQIEPFSNLEELEEAE
jgi:hypothetical protein